MQYSTKVIPETTGAKMNIVATRNDDKEMLLVITVAKLVRKEFQKHKYCYENYTKLASKADSYY